MMARLDRFLPASVKRVQISDGDWIELKEFINNGDQKAIEAAGIKNPIIDPGTQKTLTPVDWERHEIERALVVLMDWSLKNAEDKPVKVSAAALRALDPDTFEEINSAVVTHLIEIGKEKKARRESKMKQETPTPPDNSNKPSSEPPSS